MVADSTVLSERRQFAGEATRAERQQPSERRQLTLAERRRAGRQAHRDQIQQRGGQPTRTTRSTLNRRAEPSDQRQAPAQRPAEQQPVQPRPQQTQQDPQGPRLR
ncbi:hypothetical protein [Kitasatospora purpeofusca]|uniref:hypothetical protein n=1 Tax=Kitasatospora purpeofusca TaxID=67352 RepID=UPI0036B5A96C